MMPDAPSYVERQADRDLSDGLLEEMLCVDRPPDRGIVAHCAHGGEIAPGWHRCCRRRSGGDGQN